MSNSKLEQLEEKKKTFEDLMKSIEKDEAKAKKIYDEKMADIIAKKKAFEEQLKAIEKEESKVKKTYDEKMADISPKKKTFEDTLKAIEKDEAKIKKSVASSLAKKESKDDSDNESKKSDSDSEKTSKKKKAIPKKIKELVWNNHIGHDIANSMCTCCEKTPIKNTEFHCGHVLAEANGGTLEITNLRPICAGCNLSMGTQNMDDFKKVFGLGKKEKKLVLGLKKTN
jgi:DNA repair exonuclease SbcCD ATPase subunit